MSPLSNMRENSLNKNRRKKKRKRKSMSLPRWLHPFSVGWPLLNGRIRYACLFWGTSSEGLPRDMEELNRHLSRTKKAPCVVLQVSVPSGLHSLLKPRANVLRSKHGFPVFLLVLPFALSRREFALVKSILHQETWTPVRDLSVTSRVTQGLLKLQETKRP